MREDVYPGKPEVLAPAGSFESFKAAVHAGADAVYLGGSRFGARAYAGNLDEGLLLSAIDYAHLHGRRVYLTVNTLLKERELADLYGYLEPYVRQGLDAVIVQDFGVLSLIRQAFPELPVHASTQMTVTGPYGAKALKGLGAVRVVPARELSLEEAAAIRREAGVEVECFVHGALCYCYSGQCLLSSMIGGRSGNRGRCAQPCRLPYEVRREGRRVSRPEERYVLSLKDLCTVSRIPDLVDAGIDSLKIEGRMKSPRYTAGVVSVYRKYVDLYREQGRKGFRVDPEDIRMLKDLFDRGGFTDGYLSRRNGRDMVAWKEKPAFREGNQALYRYLDDTYVNARIQEPVRGEVSLLAGRPSVLELESGGTRCRVEGETPQPARSQPITMQKLAGQMRKTGNSPFAFPEPDALKVRMDDGLFLPVQALNELRRRGLEALELEILKPYRRAGGIIPGQEVFMGGDEEPSVGGPARLHVLTQSREQLGAALSFSGVARIYLEAASWPEEDISGAVKECHMNGKECFLALPAVFRQPAARYVEENWDAWVRSGLDGLLARSLEGLCFVQSLGIGLPVAADAGLYGWNRMASGLLRRLGASEQTVPWELNSRELEEVGCRGKEMVVYGYLPVMVTAQCVHGAVEGCGHQPGLLYLKDRTGKELPVQNMCRFCYNVVYNPSPLSLLGQSEILGRLRPASWRIQLSIESGGASRDIIAACLREFSSEGETQGAGALPRDFTRGHLKRGVE